MHMADALLSPAVGGTMWAATAALITYSSVKIKKELDTKKIPLMGVLGAFIFAAQMINFSIPGTGSSGHLGGGMILAILLGPYAGFLTIASVLVIQALFFGDGGLLALGCNIFNLGFFPCFVAYPFIYKKLKGNKPFSVRSLLAVLLSVIIGLQLGSIFVVLETFLSGIPSLPLSNFILLMQPIHLAIGFVEALVTITIINFLYKARPDVLETTNAEYTGQKRSYKKVIIIMLVITAVTGGVFSWFASANPDGLEWAIFRTSGKEELNNPGTGIHNTLQDIQDKTAILPDYNFRNSADSGENASWPAVASGTTVSGLVGAAITLASVVLLGVLINLFRKKKTN